MQLWLLREVVTPIRTLLHFLARALGNERLAGASFPSAAERLVERDQVGGDRRMPASKIVLFLQLRALRIQHALEVHRAFSILNESQLH